LKLKGGGLLQEALRIRSFIGTHDKNWEDTCFYQHDSLEITIVLDGSGVFRYEDRQYSVDAGQVVLIPSNFLHSFHAVKPIRFGVLLIEGLPARIKELFDRLITNHLPRIITLSRLDQEQYELLFRQWLRVMTSPLKDPDRNFLTWIEVLLLYLEEHSQSDQHAFSIAYIADYIRQNLQNRIQISALAELVGLSEEGFRKRFYKVYNMTPKQYQQISKLTEAKWLLSSSDKNLHAIAELVGFTQLHSFSSWFKKLEDCSPSEWRNTQRMFHR